MLYKTKILNKNQTSIIITKLIIQYMKLSF